LEGTGDPLKVSRRRCCAIGNSNERKSSVCINSSFKVAVLPISLSAQGTSAAEIIFAGIHRENYFVLAAVVGAVYQFKKWNSRKRSQKKDRGKNLLNRAEIPARVLSR
jgi:hypothetical protein